MSRLSALACFGLLSGCGGEALFLLSSFEQQVRLPNGVEVVEVGDRTLFGDIQCDQNGRYLGGGSPQSAQAVKTGLERGIDDAKREINDLNRAIDICKGRQLGMADYKAQFGCDEARIRQLAAEAAAARSKVQPLEQKIFAIANEIEGKDARLKTEKNMAAAEHARLMQQITKDTGRQLMLELEARPLRAEYRRLESERWRIYEACNKAEDAAWADPCFTPNVTEMFGARRELEQRVQRYEQRLDRLENCSEDQVRQSQSSVPDRAGGTVIPGLILQQVLPGLIAPPRHPPSGHPPPRRQQPSGGQWQDHRN